MIPVSDRPIHLLTLAEAIAERDYWIERAKEPASQYIKTNTAHLSQMCHRLANRCQIRINELNGGPSHA